jgi:hypothetical protein
MHRSPPFDSLWDKLLFVASIALGCSLVLAAALLTSYLLDRPDRSRAGLAERPAMSMASKAGRM